MNAVDMCMAALRAIKADAVEAEVAYVVASVIVSQQSY